MITQQVTLDSYFLPEDGDIAKVRFLDLLHNPGETFIASYGFTLEPMFNEILAADESGVPVHMLLDHTQSCGRSEKAELTRICPLLKHSDITITTAGCGSHQKSAIWHYKAMVVRATDGGEDWCLTGSVNFSPSGFNQGNFMAVFRSKPWAETFIAQFLLHRDWARANEIKYQCYSTDTYQAPKTSSTLI